MKYNFNAELSLDLEAGTLVLHELRFMLLEHWQPWQVSGSSNLGFFSSKVLLS